MLLPRDPVGTTGTTTYRLGIIDMRLLATAGQTDGAFAMAEFSGREGPWTVPHIHRTSLEAFFVLDGRFTFTLAKENFETGPGQFVLIPRGKPHLLRAETDGSRLLTVWTPGGLEQMFVELSRLSPDALRDPVARRAISARFDSIPV
jgi:quercetin dioxygenase-like cupin family protein